MTEPKTRLDPELSRAKARAIIDWHVENGDLIRFVDRDGRDCLVERQQGHTRAIGAGYRQQPCDVTASGLQICRANSPCPRPQS